MSKTKTIYSVEQVYTKFLEDGEKQNFVIPAYQRGYKWTSDGVFSHVQTLMRDLYSAYSRNNGNPYYLQFITLKSVGDNFEIIDGQQRLTTLSILFCVWSHLHPSESDSFVINKLKYEVRRNFIDQFIYADIGNLLSCGDWQDFLTNNSSSHDDIDIAHDDRFINYWTDYTPFFTKNRVIYNIYRYVKDGWNGKIISEMKSVLTNDDKLNIILTTIHS